MKIKSNREELLRCLDSVKDAADSSIKPILANVLLRVEKESLTMITTNHEIQITARACLQADGDFERIVPATKLQGILRSFGSDAVVEINFEENKAVVSSGRSSFKLLTHKTDDFVLMGETGKIEKLEDLASAELLTVMKKVNYASAQASHRNNLNGVLMERNGDGIHFAATDGHRLAVQTVAKEGAKKETRHIIPRKTVDILIQRLRNEGNVEISANDRVVKFKTEDFEFISNIIDENYPDYRNVIPRQSNNKTAVIERQKLQEVMKHADALAMSAGSRQDAVVIFTFTENKLHVKASNRDEDSLEDSAEIKYGDEEMEIGFNIQFINDIVNALNDDIIEIKIGDKNGGVIVQPAGEDESFVYVVMPVRF